MRVYLNGNILKIILNIFIFLTIICMVLLCGCSLLNKQKSSLSETDDLNIQPKEPEIAENTKTSEIIQRLFVHKEGRFLQKENGEPFFWLADTAWELAHRLNRTEVDTYLQDRANKGFNVIKFVLLAELDGLTDANAYGDLPLMDYSPSKPVVTEGNNPDNPEEYDYWDHVDYIIDRCGELNLYAGVLPTWGDKVLRKWGSGPEVFNTSNAYTYGWFLGDRYKNRKNIVWILGGDRPAAEGPKDKREIWRAMAEGIADGVNGVNNQDGKADYSKTIMTYHPIGGKSSSDWFHEDEWLDFNMYQSGHAYHDNTFVWTQMKTDWDKIPAKPSFDGEPNYEDNPSKWFNDYDVRKASYRSVFAGGMGITYGAHGIWQMYAPGRNAIGSCRKYWYDSLNLPGASQMVHLKNLMLSRPYFVRIPDDTLVEEIGTSGDRMAATRASDGSYAMIYFPRETLIRKIFASKLSGAQIKAWWYNPRDGKCYDQQGNETLKPFKEFDKTDVIFNPPGENDSLDWVLILDDASKSFAIPGHIK